MEVYNVLVAGVFSQLLLCRDGKGSVSETFLEMADHHSNQLTRP